MLIKILFLGSVEIIFFTDVPGGVCCSERKSKPEKILKNLRLSPPPPPLQPPLRYPSKTGSSWIYGIDVRSGISTEPFFINQKAVQIFKGFSSRLQGLSFYSHIPEKAQKKLWVIFK